MNKSLPQKNNRRKSDKIKYKHIAKLTRNAEILLIDTPRP